MMPWKDSRFKIEVVENRRVGGKNMLLFLWHYETYRNHTIQISFKRHAILQLRYILKKQQNEEISSKVIAHPSKYTNHVGGENFEHQLGWMFSEKFKIPSSIAPDNIAMLEEKQKFIIEADQLCHKQISKISSENDVLNFENDDIEK